MGTYMNVQLKFKTEQHIKNVNDQLEKMGLETPVYNGVKYGAFTTWDLLKEDARFMNEDPEGLKQMPHWERPITATQLESFIWNKIGFCQYKLSGDHEDHLRPAYILAKWIEKNEHLIDKENSDNYSLPFVKQYAEGYIETL